MSQIQNIIIHCSDSLHGCAREIRRWHMEKGWRDIGYHYVIGNGQPIKTMRLEILDGMIECGRYLDEDLTINGEEQGAHALGYNSSSLGICLIGRNQFTSLQMIRLFKLCEELIQLYDLKTSGVLGHYETASGHAQGKTCPNLDMNSIRHKLFTDIC